MKTDPFNDRIRQKLDSVEPPYRDADWTQFQRRLPGRVLPFGGAVGRWAAVAAASAVIGTLSFAAITQYQTQRRLEATVGQLTTTLSQLQKTHETTLRQIEQLSATAPAERPERDRSAAPTARPDTVYITRYVPGAGAVPNAQRSDDAFSDVGTENATSERLASGSRAGGPVVLRERTERSADPRPDVPTQPRSTDVALSPESTAPNVAIALPDRATATAPADRPREAPTGNVAEPLRSNVVASETKTAGRTNVAPRSETASRTTSPTKRGTANRANQASGEYAWYANVAKPRRSTGRIATSGRLTAGAMNNNVAPPTAGTSAEPNAARPGKNAGSAPATVALSPTRLNVARLNAVRSLQRDSAYYRSGWQQRAERMRLPRWAQVAIAAANQSALTPDPAPTRQRTANAVSTRFRLGPLVEIGTRQTTLGLTGDLLLNERWLLSAGVAHTQLASESFQTEADFDQRTRQNFRRDFVPGQRPEDPILNIDRTGVAWQIPLSVGYRVTLPKQWSLVPTAGLTLSYWNRETLRFSFWRGGPRGFDSRELTVGRPQHLLHTAQLAVLAERQFGRVALQAGPYASLPLTSNPRSLAQPSVGVRLRVAYGF